jgi:hypothetical protein
MDPISSKSWSLSQMKQAPPVKLEADVILVKIFEQLICYFIQFFMLCCPSWSQTSPYTIKYTTICSIIPNLVV